MYITIPVIGFIVGMLIGITGMGGGALVTPALILFAGVPPLRAVGSDLVFAALTKLVAAREHLSSGSVDVPVVRALATGSLPAALISTVVLQRYLDRPGTEQVVMQTLGGVLVVAALLIVARGFRRVRLAGRIPRGGLVAGGAVVGALVGLTSVGSGTLVIATLSFTTALPARTLVGTDTVHALALTSVAALAHLRLGTVDPVLTALLLAGSIPGVVLGARLTPRVPDEVLRGVLAAVLLVAGLRLQVPVVPRRAPVEPEESSLPGPTPSGSQLVAGAAS